MSASDPLAAMVAYLRTKLDLDSDRITRPDLPEADAPGMPAGAVVIRPAGGYTLFGASNAPIGDPRLDIFCFAETWDGAYHLATETVIALRALRTSTWAHTRLMWARIEGGPMPFEDPETQWPCAVVSAQVGCCELAVA